MEQTQVRKDIKSEAIREKAKVEKHSTVCRRMLGIAHLVEGGSRQEAQKIACLNVNNFRVWIKRFNESGISGLYSNKQTGRPQKLTREILEKLKEKIKEGPTDKEMLVRYRLVDFQEYLTQEHNISMSLSGLWYKIQRLGFSWKTGRQRHPQSNFETQEDFKKNSEKSV